PRVLSRFESIHARFSANRRKRTPAPRGTTEPRRRAWKKRDGGRTGKLRGRPSRSLHHTRDRGNGRGLNPPPDERGPAVVEYDDGVEAGLDDLQVLFAGELLQSPEAPICGRFRQLRAAPGGELSDRRRGMAKAQLGDLTQVVGE